MESKLPRKRGPQRLRPEDGTFVTTIKFRPREYAKLKCLSIDTGKPVRELLMEAVLHTYGETTKEEMSRIYPEMSKPSTKPLIVPKNAPSAAEPLDRPFVATTWSFSTDTIYCPQAVDVVPQQRLAPVKPKAAPSTIRPSQRRNEGDETASKDLMEMLEESAEN